MFIIGEAAIDDAVREASFFCDLDRCKGACCCIEGGRGAPLEDGEILQIEKAYPLVKQYLSQENISTIETIGMYEGSPGNYTTVCIHNRECVFVHFEGGVARCSFETAYGEGRIEWRKPISCHLFPVRIRKGGFLRLTYEQIDECRAGREKGERLGIPLADFLKDALIRNFGETWYDEFLSQVQQGARS